MCAKCDWDKTAEHLESLIESMRTGVDSIQQYLAAIPARESS